MMNVQQPLFSHFQQNSSATPVGFTVMEDHILVPTPRKVRNLNSPLPKRKTTQEPNVLFGEAGQELQTILFQGSDSSDTETSEEEINEIIEMRHKHQPRGFHSYFESPAVSFVDRNPNSPKFQRIFEEASPPVRSSNPITMNSPFHYNQESLLPQMRTVNYPEVPLEQENNTSVRRYRSCTWPAVCKTVTSE